ncbi:sensor histidine kinase [Roseobacteraceae bacterium S113]
MFLSRVRSIARQSAIRLTASLLIVFAIITLFAWAGTYFLVQREMMRLVDARLANQLGLVERAIRSGEDLPPLALGQSLGVIDGRSLIGSVPLNRDDVPGQDGFYSDDPLEPELRFFVRRMADGRRIIVAESTERQAELLETLADGLRLSLWCLLGASVIAGALFAWRGQTRLARVSAGLEKVARGQLATRIALPGRRDDLTVLAERINTTTAQLERSMEQMRVQSSNIAHDLRTPLARLRAEIESALIDLTENDLPISAETMGAGLEQIDTIIGTFNALLRLSRIESGAGKAGFADLELAALAGEVAETFAPVVEDAGQTLVFESTAPAQVRGDRDMLVQLIANLIQNALRYGAPHQQITLRVQGRLLQVMDQGPGIPEAEREKVLQPLYQLENTRQSDGFGLGLSMVSAISDLHGADLMLGEGDGGQGLAVGVEFPKITEV